MFSCGHMRETLLFSWSSYRSLSCRKVLTAELVFSSYTFMIPWVLHFVLYFCLTIFFLKSERNKTINWRNNFMNVFIWNNYLETSYPVEVSKSITWIISSEVMLICVRSGYHLSKAVLVLCYQIRLAQEACLYLNPCSL